MVYCSNCGLIQSRWHRKQGFTIGKKKYCCMECGFSGCICLPRPNRKTLPKSVRDQA